MSAVKKQSQRAQKPAPKEKLLKRDMQPSFPHGLRVSKSDSIMILDFLTSKETDDYNRSFASIVVNKHVAKDLLLRLIRYIDDNGYEIDGVDIKVQENEVEDNDDGN